MSESEYPFSLKGTKESFRGSGRPDAEAEASRVFTLSRGIVIVDVEPKPDGFVLKIASTEELPSIKNAIVGSAISLSPIGGATALSRSGSLSAGMAGGAALGAAGMASGAPSGGVGSVAKTIVEGAVGVGGFARRWAEKAHDRIKPRFWTPAALDVAVVSSDDKKSISNYQSWLSLTEGKYRLEVESERPWRIELIQPDIGQSYGPLVDAFGADKWESGGAARIVGPYHSNSRPILASIQHRGRGAFAIVALAVDGTHQCRMYYQDEGQFAMEDQQTGIMPGKEYMLYIVADGDWRMKLKEGY